MNQRLRELKHWLKECHFPDNIINKAFHDAALQGPAALKDNMRHLLPRFTVILMMKI